MSGSMRSRVQGAIIVALLLVIAAMAYKFIVAGSVGVPKDGRTPVVLTAGERAFVLREMRGFVAGLQRVVDGLARDDMKAVAAASRAMGAAAAHDAPVALVGKLPLDFKKLAFGVHGEFDRIAADAESLGDPKHTLSRLAQTLGKCDACHEAYLFEASPGH